MTILAPGIYGPKRGLVAYYSMDDRYTDGTTAIDTTTNNNNATIIGSTTGSTGQINEAYDFDGVDDYVDVPALGILGNHSVTMVSWHKPSATADTKNIVTAFGNRTTDQACAFNTTGDGSFSFFFWGNSLSVTVPNYYGSWTHSVARYDAATGTRDFWHNGSSAGSDIPPTPNFANQSYAVGLLPGGTNYYDGLIDEVRWYDRALSDAEITELYNEV